MSVRGVWWFEAGAEDRGLSLNAAVLRIGPRVEVNPDTLRGWCKQGGAGRDEHGRGRGQRMCSGTVGVFGNAGAVAVMTLDVYASHFDDDLEALADRMDAAADAAADFLRTRGGLSTLNAEVSLRRNAP